MLWTAFQIESFEVCFNRYDENETRKLITDAQIIRYYSHISYFFLTETKKTYITIQEPECTYIRERRQAM